MDDPVVKQVHKMCSTIEALGQELQEARAERDHWKNEAWNQKQTGLALAGKLQEARAENRRLREALDTFIPFIVSHGHLAKNSDELILALARLRKPSDE